MPKSLKSYFVILNIGDTIVNKINTLHTIFIYFLLFPFGKSISIIVVIAIASVILARVEAVAAASVVIGEIMYPDYHNSDNHDDPEGLIPLEKAETSAIIIA